MRLRSYWSPWAMAATIVFACAGVAHAQARTPATVNPAGPPVVVPQGIRSVPTAAYTPSPEMLQQMRKSEEYSRTHGTTVFVPPHPAKHWGTANGRPPERYHGTAPPTPSSGASGPQSLAEPQIYAPDSSTDPIYTQYQGASWNPGVIPMDLSAAVDAAYMVQFTNNGLYILNKTSGSVAKMFSPSKNPGSPETTTDTSRRADRCSLRHPATRYVWSGDIVVTTQRPPG